MPQDIIQGFSQYCEQVRHKIPASPSQVHQMSVTRHPAVKLQEGNQSCRASTRVQQPVSWRWAEHRIWSVDCWPLVPLGTTHWQKRLFFYSFKWCYRKPCVTIINIFMAPDPPHSRKDLGLDVCMMKVTCKSQSPLNIRIGHEEFTHSWQIPDSTQVHGSSDLKELGNSNEHIKWKT